MQLSIFDVLEKPAPIPVSEFGGDLSEQDRQRCKRQFQAVFNIMRAGEWIKLSELAFLTNASESSCSARLRDCRKEKFGGHTVERRRLDGGLFEYRLILKPSPLLASA